MSVGAEHKAPQDATGDALALAGSRATALAAAAPTRSRRAGAEAWTKAGHSPIVLAAVAAVGLLPAAMRLPVLHDPTLGASLSTSLVLCAFAAAWLQRTRFSDSRQLRDLLTLGGISMLGLTAMSLHGLSLLHAPSTGQVAAGMVARVLVAAVFAAASFTPGERLVVGARSVFARVAFLGACGAAVVACVGLVLEPRGAVRSGVGVAAGSALGHAPVLVLAVASTLVMGAAAARLEQRRWRGDSDPALGWLAAGLMLLATGGLYHIALGPVVSGRLGIAQLPTMAGFALILVAASRHEPEARARVARAAALAERRRVARDLHDGLAQDLAFIAAHAPTFAEDLGEDHPVVVAARRALAISRSTIADLSDPAATTAVESLEAVAQELREQFDIAIAVDSQLDADLAPHARGHVSRIAREAIANAARHGGARNVSVSLKRLELATVLRVVDDGCGVADADGTTAPDGFGLTSMRERAAALGGYLSIHQPRRGGTELEVVFR